MRMYVFCNNWLSDIQRGIQGAHAIVQMTADNSEDKSFQDQYLNWAVDYKTLAFLNGGGSGDLDDLYEFLYSPDYPHYIAKFYEDDESLGGALTAVALLLSDYEVEAISEYRKTPFRERKSFLQNYAEPTAALIERIAGYRLA